MKSRVLVGLAFFAAMVAPVLDPASQLYYRDTGRLYYPLKHYIAERLRQGQLPLWNPWTEAGVSLLGQLSPGLFHPYTLLYALPFDLAFKLNHLLPLFVAGLGAALLARRLGASHSAALAAGLVFGGSGYLVSQAASNLIFAVGTSTIPLAVERLLAFLEKPTAGRLLVASALLASMAWGGEPQSMLLAGLLGTAFALRLRLRGALLAALWGAVALGLSAPSALPAVYQLQRSSRANGLSAGEKLRFFIPPQRWPGLMLARAFDDAPEVAASSLAQANQRAPFGEYFAGGDENAFSVSIYLGAPALLFAAFALRRRRGRALLLGALVVLCAAGGEELGVYGALSHLVPGFGLFRYAEKLAGLLSLLLALACALGLDEAFAKPRALATAAGAAALACFGLSLVHPDVQDALARAGTLHDPAVPARFLAMLAAALRQEAVLLAAIFAIAAVRALRPSLQGARLFAASACGVAVLLANAPNLLVVPVEFFHDVPATARELIQRGGPSAGRWRVWSDARGAVAMLDADPKSAAAVHQRASLLPQYDALFGCEGINDYFSAQDPLYEQMINLAPAPALRLLETRFLLVQRREMSAREAASRGFTRIHYGLWLRDDGEHPRAFLMDGARAVRDPDEAGARLTDSATNPWRTAFLLPRDATYASWPQTATGTLTAARPRAERIEARVTVPARTLLGISEHFDPGWSARVDGNSAAVLQLDGFLMAVPVGAGKHQVELTFRPRGLVEGAVVLLSTLCAVAVTILVRRVTKSVTPTRSKASETV